MLLSGRSRFVHILFAAAIVLSLLSPPPLAAQQWTYTGLAGPTGGGAHVDGNGLDARLYGARLLVNPAGTYVYIGGGASLRRYDVATGEITSVAGYPYTLGTQDGTEATARFGGMAQMSFDANGNIVIAEGTRQIIRRVTPAAVVTRVAGITTLPVPICQNSTPLNSGFYNPTGIAVDKTTNAIYVVDMYTGSIRKITSTAVTTFAGTCGTQGEVDGTGAAARFTYPGVAAIDASGNLFVTDTQYNLLRRITPAAVVTTVIGTLPFGQGVGYRDGSAANALFQSLDDLAFAPNGDLYITDSRNRAIRKYANGIVSTVASSATAGLTDGPVGTATLSAPFGLTIDAAGTVYFTDSGTLRRLSNGVITTLAGSPSLAGAVNGSAANARFNSPRAAVADAAGNVYVTDGPNGAVRKITASGDVTTFAGILGTPGQVDGPAGTGSLGLAEAITLDSQGNVYVGEYSAIRKITPDGTISTLAGSKSSTGFADGPAATARFNNIGAVCAGPTDEIYVADMNNNRVRKVLPDGTVSTLAGAATLGYVDGPGASARFQYPSGCAWTGGFLYVTDLYNNRIRRIAADGTVSTVAGNANAATIDGAGTGASFNNPWGLAADGAGRLFVYEWASGKVRMTNPANSFWTVTIGPGNASVDDGTFNFGGTSSWHSIASDANSNLFFTSATANTVRKASIAIDDAPAIDAASGPVGVARQLSTTGTAATSWQWQIIRRPMLSSPQSAALSNPTIPNPTFTPDAAGLYRIRLMASGPAGMSGRIVDFTATCGTVPTPAIAMTSGTNPTCANGSVTLDAGAGYTSYLWSTGATTRTITVAPASTTTYTVRGHDGICASAQASLAVTVYSAPTASVSLAGANAVCPNGLGGTATVTLGGGPVSGQQWVWRSGAGAFSNIPGQTGTSYALSGSDFPGPGSYTIAVRVTPSCGGAVVTSNEVAITVYNPQAGTVTASGPTTFCAGGSVTLTAPTSPSYLWSNGATTEAITVDASGSYSVTVTDANGCTATTNPTVVTVSNPPATPTITPSGATTFCDGGSVTLTASAAASWLWSTGATTQSIVVEGAGSYTVTATNAAGCSTTSAATAVTVHATPATPDVTASGPTTFCEGGSVTLTAPDGFTYAWSNGATTRSIAVSTAGIYNVTVTDANGCSATSGGTIVTVNPPPAATITPSGPTTFCDGGSVTLTASAGVSWLWSNGATTQSIVASATGSHSVTVTNANGCSATSAATAVTENPLPAKPVINASSPALCPGGSGVTLTAPAASSWLWSNGATTQSILVTEPGSFTVRVWNGACESPVSNPVTLAYRQVVVTPSGPTTFCNGNSVTLFANTGTSWLWSNGATTQSTVVSEGGSYTVTATFADGCAVTSAPIVLSEVTAAITADRTAVCPGGSIQFDSTVDGGSNYSYQWYDQTFAPIAGATSPQLTLVPAQSGFVYLQVTDAAAGCPTTSSEISFTVEPAIDATITASDSICETSSGIATVPNAGPGATYQWSITNGLINGGHGSTDRQAYFTATGTAPMTLTVTVTNPGCSVTSSKIVTLNPSPDATISAGGPTTFCEGGSVTLTAPAGHTYGWSTGATTQSINVTASGNYYVTVTTAAGCATSSAATTVTVNPLPSTPVITAGGPTTFCEGGSVTLTAPAGFSYLWSTGATTQSISATAAGSYSVTVTNANGCSATSAATSVTVNALPSTPEITAGGPTTFCEGGSVTLTAPAGFSYLWSNGATTQSINATAAGSYTVTVTNANGCSATSEATAVTVNPPPATPAISAGGPTSFCEGGSVTLTAPAGYSYLWSTGATTQSIDATASGGYSVTVTNANGCSATSAATTVTVNAPPATPAITAGGPTTFCEGGSVTLSAPAGYSYLWSTGATSQSINAAAAGSYTVTVTDANGCSATSAATAVTVNAPPATPAITAGGPTTFCEGGSVTLTAPAGYSYLWSTGATTQSIDATASGNYTVTVANGNGCSATSAATSVTVNPPPATPAITAGGPTTFCEGGSVTLTAPAGYTYLWSTGATTQSIDAAASGSYTVTVTNANGCSATSAATAVTVNAPPATPAISADGPTTFCEGGSVTLSAPAGYSYLWSTGATTQSINATAAGSYTVTVTDANGCSATSTATTVTVNPPPSTPVISAGGPTTFCEGGSVTLTAPAGFSYLWSTGATTQSIDATTSGNYSVTVTNGNGCSATSAATTVTENPPPSTPAITAGGPTTFCAGGSVTLTAPAGFSYLWSTGATTQSIDVTATGSYNVTVTNGNGCSATSAATAVTVNVPPSTPTISAGGPTTFCQGGSVTLTASAAASYLWSNGATTSSINVNASGSYSVTVTDANGCSATSAATAVTVNDPPAAPAITPNGPTAFCEGGTVRLSAPAGFSYLWSTGSTAQFIDVTATGSYTVTVTNANGCSATSAATAVTVNAPPAVPAITPNGPTTFCQGSTVRLTAPAGFSAYLWSNGSTAQFIDVTAGGNYTVQVTNANGCSATSAATTVTVNPSPAAPTITPNGPTTFCQGGTVRLTAPAGFSAYLWSNGSTAQFIDVTVTGNYTVQVTNANGCSATSAATTVTVNPPPATPTITPNGPTTFCQGGTVRLTAPAGFSAYLWSTGSTAQFIDVTAGGNYTVQVTNANGCSATSAPRSVTVNPLPAEPVISPAGTPSVCPGSSVTLTAPAGYTYLWSNGATTQSINVAWAQAGTSFTVTVTNANGCSRTSAPKAVTKNPATVITTHPQSQTMPRYVTRTLTVVATGTPNLQYQWYLGNVGDTSRPQGTNSPSLTIGPFTKKGTSRFWVRVWSSGCPSSSVNSNAAVITVN